MRERGFTVIELMLVAAIFSSFLIVSYMLLSAGFATWRKTEGRQDMDLEFSKAAAALRRDLRDSSFRQCATAATPWLPPGEPRGNALWLLSAIDPASGDYVRKADGTPFWQRNILYYLAIPTDHDKLYGVRCQTNRRNFCPHGVLVRRVFDIDPQTSPAAAESKMERLMTNGEAGDRMERPMDLQSALGNPEAESEEIVATGLVDFQVRLAPSTRWPSEVEIQLTGFQLAEAGKTLALGNEDLSQSPYTKHALFSLFPSN